MLMLTSRLKREFDVVRLMNFEFVVVIPAYRFAQMDATVVRVHFLTFRVAKHENSSLCAFLVAFMLLCDFFHDNLVYGLMPSNNSLRTSQEIVCRP